MIPNKEQKELINELDKNILLIASAGTGKTEAMALRIVNIIKSNKGKIRGNIMYNHLLIKPAKK